MTKFIFRLILIMKSRFCTYVCVLISILFLSNKSFAHENDIILKCKLTNLFDKDRDFNMDVNFESIVSINFNYNNNKEDIEIFDDTKLLGKTFKGEKFKNYFVGKYVGKYDHDTKILIDRTNGFFMREGFSDGVSFYEFTGKCNKMDYIL